MADTDKPGKPNAVDEATRESVLQGMAGFDALLNQASKKVEAAKVAESTRSLATKIIASRENDIATALANGLPLSTVESFLVQALPQFSLADIRYGLNRLRRALQPSRARSGARPGPTPAPAPAQTAVKRAAAGRGGPGALDGNRQSAGIPDLPTWADGSDKRADETDADYRLRKQFEGPPEAKRKFIGEHNT
jgi:hypothetical protein